MEIQIHSITQCNDLVLFTIIIKLNNVSFGISSLLFWILYSKSLWDFVSFPYLKMTRKIFLSCDGK